MDQHLKDLLMALALAHGDISPTINKKGVENDWNDCYCLYPELNLATLWFNDPSNSTIMVKIELEDGK